MSVMVGIEQLRREDKRSLESALTPAPLLRVACWMVLHMLPGRELIWWLGKEEGWG